MEAPAGAPAAPAEAPARPAAVDAARPPPADPAPAAPQAPLPSALAAEGVRPVVQSLWRAIEAVDAGDADAMSRVMVPQARWFPPGSPSESVRGAADLRRAMSPWASPQVELDVRRVIDLGDGPIVVQAVASAVTGDPRPRYELVLLVELQGDRIASVRHYGDPLGPVRVGPDPEEPLDLGPPGEVELERGTPEASHVATAEALVEALDGRKDAAARALLAEDVVLHDVVARRTRRGRERYLAGYRAMLGDTGHPRVDRRHAGAGFVVLEGAVHGRDPTAEDRKEHGFADVHRVIDGTIVETWHYLNRRGRPLQSRTRP